MSASLVLTAREGDPQAAKATVAAAASSCPFKFSPIEPDKAFGAFSGKLELQLPSGATINEPNAAARAAAQGKLGVSESWLSWEERTLRPAVYASELPLEHCLSHSLRCCCM